jgi:DNA-binding XRE family transcriptional regulator
MMKRSWDSPTMRFASARYVSRQRILEVTFENGDHFLVATESLLPGASNGPPPAASPDWTGLRVGETGDVLEVPAADAFLEVPWDRIRALVDPNFRAHLRAHARERVRRLGELIRAFRREAGLSRAALAKKVGLSPQVLAELEQGRREPRSEFLQPIALALGKRLRDFVAD